MECYEANLQKCTCSYPSCERKGKCCECISYHRQARQLPACFFPKEVERTYDRSYKRFIDCFKEA